MGLSGGRCDRQTKTQRTLSGARREERMEDPLPQAGGNSRTGIRNRQPDDITGLPRHDDIGLRFNNRGGGAVSNHPSG